MNMSFQTNLIIAANIIIIIEQHREIKHASSSKGLDQPMHTESDLSLRSPYKVSLDSNVSKEETLTITKILRGRTAWARGYKTFSMLNSVEN